MLDDMLDVAIAEQLRKLGHNVEAVQGNADLEGRKDPDLLRAASELDRTLVTDNVQDFARMHQHLLRSGESHGGIVLVSPMRYPRSKATLRTWVDGQDKFLRAQVEGSFNCRVYWLP